MTLQNLQPILFPMAEAKEQQLWFRYHGQGVRYEDGEMTIAPGTAVDFGTYFNSFSYTKWIRYTGIRRYRLHLKVKGKGSICVYRFSLDGGTVRQEEICTEAFDHKKAGELILDLSTDMTRRKQTEYGFSVTADSRELVVSDAYYGTDEEVHSSDIRLALAFTTYRREEDITANVKNILNLQDDRIRILIADNAGTLSPDDLGTDGLETDVEGAAPAAKGKNRTIIKEDAVRIFRNINSGGAGGFCRCMLEVLKEKESYTHMILMDDDVLVDPRIFDRLIRFLSVVKEKYRDAIVGGAMLRKDLPWFHVESGAKWKGTRIEGYGHGLDLRRRDAILHADARRKTDYNAWWFCCIPIRYIREDNLPLPLFFQWDDIDYGIRNKAPVILLNGICLWHEAFDTKRSAMHTYYSTRNPLIVNCCHDHGEAKEHLLHVWRQRVIAEICLYRYEQAEAMIRAAEDFLKGPKWLCTTDPEEYNKSIRELNRKVSYIADRVDFEWYLVGCGISDCDRLHALVRKLSLNGYLFSADRKHTLPLFADRPVQGYRAEKILYYEENTGTGYVAKRDRRKALACMRRCNGVYRRLKRDYEKTADAYRKEYTYMTSADMWRKYLRL